MSSILITFQLQLQRISELLKSSGGAHASGPKKPSLSESEGKAE